MYIRILLIIFLVIFLSGCATTKGRQNIQMIQQLQARLNGLEAELERKNQEISDLENELDSAPDMMFSSGKRKIKNEDKGALELSVRHIQTALKKAGFYKGPIDSKIGPQTKEAIKDFQRANNLKVDGVVGKRTQAELSRYLEH